MISSRRRLVAASVLLALEALAFALFVTESVTGAIAAVGFTCLSVWVHVVLHECGHLVVAKLLRLPVLAVRVAPFTGWRNEVVVRPAPSMAALPLRMVLFYLGGPMANLCAATALAAAGASTGTPMTRRAASRSASATRSAADCPRPVLQRCWKAASAPRGSSPSRPGSPSGGLIARNVRLISSW
ncbi:hypothetical protein [Micromonospora chersina]|uniref:hypothetical protein n=1 Tax=Micromonospora chersina TaxID=47854 RepID=UPI0033DA743F